MTIEEIKSSGMLQAFAEENLSPIDHEKIKFYLDKYPELQNELAIFNLDSNENSSVQEGDTLLSNFKVEQNVDDHVADDEFTDDSDGKNAAKAKSFFLPTLILSTILALSWIIAFTNYNKKVSLNSEVDTLLNSNLLLEAELKQSNDFIRHISSPHNKVFYAEVSDTYKESEINLHHNIQTGKNYLNILSSQQLMDEEVFQLWSIIPDFDPEPLNTFKNQDRPISFPINSNETQGSYIITIELESEISLPSLENLVATIVTAY